MLMVDWVGAEKTGVPYALALALRGKSLREIARETGIAESSLSEKNMSTRWAAVDKHILDALALALRCKPIREIVRQTGVPASSLYSIRKHGPYEHRNRQRL
jgi:DNA-binding Xre family transcriptional regulator